MNIITQSLYKILTGGAHFLGVFSGGVLAGDVAALDNVEVVVGEGSEAGAGVLQ